MDELGELGDERLPPPLRLDGPRSAMNGPNFSAYCCTASGPESNANSTCRRATFGVTPACEHLAHVVGEPHCCGVWAPSGGVGMYEPVSLNSPPAKPSSAHVVIPMRPPGRHTRISSCATLA